MRSDLISELFVFLDASPTPYHAVAHAAQSLAAAGFREVRESETWSVEPGDRVYLTRADASIAAFVMGAQSPHRSGFRLIGAHTDSPNLRLKPVAGFTRFGYHQWGVETYGGVLLSTWLDRDLSLAGRLLVDGPAGLRAQLVDLKAPVARIPNLAIHLNRTVNVDGLKLNAQSHMVPVVGLGAGRGELTLERLLSEQLSKRTQEPLQPEDILGFDLGLYDVQRAARGGLEGEFIHSARLDNLLGCFGALNALIGTAEQATAYSRGIVLYDHEEVGSRSGHGADSTLLEQAVTRLASAATDASHDAGPRSVSQSFLISCDAAHAVHPNYSEMHEPNHRPLLGGGPVIKRHASQSYATDGFSTAQLRRWCRKAEVEPQHFVTRSDLGCGSTIGPITASRLGIATIDVGHPLLSMHSIREMAAAKDVVSMQQVLQCYFTEP